MGAADVEISYDFKPNGVLTRKRKYNIKYIYEGDITKIIKQTHDMKFEKEYDARGNLIELNEIWSDGSYVEITKYEYNNNNKIVRKSIYRPNADGLMKLVSTRRKKYDEKNNIINKKFYFADGSMGWEVIFKYTYYK